MTTAAQPEWPGPLRPGDLVAVVAPAGPPPPEQLAAGVAVLESWGLRVTLGEHVADRHPTLPYLAGSDAERAADLQRAWCDPAVAAVLCARGGYGALRVLDLLDWDAMAAADRKIFAGSSDVTALHAVLGPRCDVVTLFSPLVATARLADDAVAAGRMRDMLFTPPSVLRAGPGAAALVGGRASGRLVGGTLSLLVSTLAVPTVPSPPDGAIVMLEDITEAPYRIDHFLTHLRTAGWFDRVAGIVLGSWHECGPLPQVRDVVVDRLVPLGVPLLWEFGFGHGPGQHTVPLGAPAELDADAGILTLLR